jgi:F-type H+-transporting ATPase subunit epsilon
LSYRKNGQTLYIAVAGGFAEVLSGRVLVLADAAQKAEEIDVAKAQAELAEAQKKLSGGSSDGSTDWDAALQSVTRAQTWIDVATRSGRSGGSAAH